MIEINNGGGTWDERAIVDAGFLELVRLGIRQPTDSRIASALAIVASILAWRAEEANRRVVEKLLANGVTPTPPEAHAGGPLSGREREVAVRALDRAVEPRPQAGLLQVAEELLGLVFEPKHVNLGPGLDVGEQCPLLPDALDQWMAVGTRLRIADRCQHAPLEHR